MTSDINELVARVRQSTNFQINKKTLRERVQTDLHIPYNNGMFKITPELLAFVSTWPDDVLYLEDTYQNPIEIKRHEFLSLAIAHYHAVMNSWHQRHAEIKQIRKI